MNFKVIVIRHDGNLSGFQAAAHNIRAWQVLDIDK